MLGEWERGETYEEKGQGDLPDWVQALVMIVVFALVVMSGLK